MSAILNHETVAVLLLVGALGVPALAQTSTPPPAQVQTGTNNGQATGTMNPDDKSTYATGQPLEMKSNEGFWGHMNPFARKKWVNRQLNPVKDRLNELDQLNAKNANDIKDVDSRAQQGIHKAQSTADAAAQQATEAGTRAGQAQQVAQQASTRTDQLHTTVSNLDQYQSVTDTEIHFRPGQSTLNAKAKEALDGIANQLNGKQGYILEVQGYSRAAGQTGIQNSQRMSNAVVRYLVTEHQVPVYRIHQLAMGNAKYESSTGSVHGTVVHVSLMQNSLAALDSAPKDASSPSGATQQ
ncbi:MAG TPA: OmpA family protein [Acidisarcina sp.]|nr:OmpA family protein [Acidisarcina sp.]